MKCTLCHSEAGTRYELDQFRVMQCRTCGLVFLDVPDKDALVKELYGTDYFLERKEYFFANSIASGDADKENDNIRDFRRGLALIRSHAPQGGRLLDLGCGVGIFLQMAKQDRWQVMGVDLSPFAVQYAREVFNLEALQGRLADLDFPAETFDVVTMWDTLEHVTDPLGELREVSRVLKKDGILLVETPNEEGLLRLLAAALYKISLGRFTYPLRKLYHTYHLYYFSVSTLTQMMKSSGLTMIRVVKKPIPVTKARGSRAEKAVVKTLSLAERILGKEYEVFVLAQKS